MDNTMALLLSDTYKQCHDRMYPNGLTKLVSYWVRMKWFSLDYRHLSKNI